MFVCVFIVMWMLIFCVCLVIDISIIFIILILFIISEIIVISVRNSCKVCVVFLIVFKMLFMF